MAKKISSKQSLDDFLADPLDKLKRVDIERAIEDGINRLTKSKYSCEIVSHKYLQEYNRIEIVLTWKGNPLG